MNEGQNQTTDTERCQVRMQSITPNFVVPAITEEQCENLKNNTGIDGTGENCDDLTGELLCDIRQALEYVVNMGVGNVFANEDSKCRDNDISPTLASMWSRIYRFVQAVTCVLCAYDPFINTLLKSGQYPEVLMGAQTETDGEMDGCCKRIGYPTWVKPDDNPSLDSTKPVSARGVAKAVADAILSVWHRWEEEPEFEYFADDMNNLSSQMAGAPAVEGDRALVASSPDCDGTAIYSYRKDVDGGDDELKWRLDDCIKEGDEHNLVNFAVTHIVKGQYATRGMYYFDGTWQMIDADLGELETRLKALEKTYDRAVTVPENTMPVVLMTVPTLADAIAVECVEGRETVILVTG